MKKFLFTTLFICLSAFTCSAASNFSPADAAKVEQSGDVVITSDARHFNPLTGIYDLNGHVYVKFPIHGESMIVEADTAQVKLYSQEVNARGNITLQFGTMTFKCDKTYVPIKERRAEVEGNIYFKHEYTEIKADSAVYNWKSKIATFKNASYNGRSKKGTLTYDVMKKKLV